MANQKAKQGGSVSQSEFVRNPVPVMTRAARGETVTLTDSRGNPRVMICIPNDDLK